LKARTNPATKPYYKCLSCSLFRQSCAGLPTRDMSQQEWCEYMRDVKDTFHLKNAWIATAADVSIKTVENIMALNFDKDILRATARRIELAVIGSVAELRCPLCYDDSALRDQIAALQQEVAYWRKENDRKAKIIDKFLTD
jgi:hypothetical protein